MKKVLLSSMCVAALSLAAAENPVYKMFPDDITFAISFDEGNCSADLSAGKGEPTRIIGETAFAPGLFGQALAKGMPQFDAGKNIDMTVPGTLLLWIAPTWKTEKSANGKEPGFVVFQAVSAKGQYELLVSKMGEQPWGHGHLNTYVQYPSAKKHTNCVIFGQGQTAKWPAGEWRMLAVTWGNGTTSFSVNGKKSIGSELQIPLSAPTEFFRVGIQYTNTPPVTDEVIILKRRLSDNEIAKIYAETQKVIAVK